MGVEGKKEIGEDYDGLREMDIQSGLLHAKIYHKERIEIGETKDRMGN